jgi:hypothetical protein
MSAFAAFEARSDARADAFETTETHRRQRI